MSPVITDLHRIVKIIFRWYENNHMKANPGKRQVLLSSNTHGVVSFDNAPNISSLSKKLFGITFDLEFKF